MTQEFQTTAERVDPTDGITGSVMGWLSANAPGVTAFMSNPAKVTAKLGQVAVVAAVATVALMSSGGAQAQDWQQAQQQMNQANALNALVNIFTRNGTPQQKDNVYVAQQAATAAAGLANNTGTAAATIAVGAGAAILGYQMDKPQAQPQVMPNNGRQVVYSNMPNNGGQYGQTTYNVPQGNPIAERLNVLQDLEGQLNRVRNDTSAWMTPEQKIAQGTQILANVGKVTYQMELMNPQIPAQNAFINQVRNTKGFVDGYNNERNTQAAIFAPANNSNPGMTR